MIRRLQKLFHENQMSLVLFALIAGMVFPSELLFLNRFSTQLLILVFFFSSLRLSLHEITGYAKDWKMLLIANAYMLIIIPLALFYPFLLVSREWALALLILGAAPTGMTIALIAELFGGKTSLALLITTTTSLLAPMTIPIIFKIAVGQAVPIPIIRMFWSLFLTIVIPFALAALVKRAMPRVIKKYDAVWQRISVICFGILIIGITASSAGDVLIAPSKRDVLILLASAIWLGALTWSAYEALRWRSVSERITIALCLVYLNNTLALFIGDKFFRAFSVTPKLLLLLVVVNLLLPPIKIAASRLTKQEPHYRHHPVT